MLARVRIRSSALALALAFAGGCALEQKMSLEVIDAPLRARGIELNAAAAPRHELRLGPYAVKQIARERSTSGEAMLPAALPRPSRFEHLEFDLVAPAERTWHADCRAQRRQARNPDLFGELDVSHDEVALACRLRDPEGRAWSIEARGDVGRGLAGEVREVEPSRVVFDLEVTTRRTFVRYVERELPIAVAQLRRRRAAAAAMLLAAPERAWLAPKLPGAEQELALAVMTALRLLPLDQTGA